MSKHCETARQICGDRGAGAEAALRGPALLKKFRFLPGADWMETLP